MLGDITAGPASMFAQWLQLVRKRTSNNRTSGFPHRSSTMPSRFPTISSLPNAFVPFFIIAIEHVCNRMMLLRFFFFFFVNNYKKC